MANGPEGPENLSIIDFLKNSFVMDTLMPLAEELSGGQPIFRQTGDPGMFSTALGRYTRPDTISLDRGLMEAVASGQLKVPDTSPFNAARTTAAHETGHFVDDKLGRMDRMSSMEREVNAHIFASLIKSFSDLASASPEQVSPQNILNRGFGYFVGEIGSDPRMREVDEERMRQLETVWDVMGKRLFGQIFNSEFYADHPARRER
jgi:hypothetical protein